MLLHDDEKKYEQVIKLLKNLPKVNTPSNFDLELNRRIGFNEPLKIKETWFDKIFSPKLIPSAALAVTTVVILLLLKGPFNDIEDPFQIIPKIREDYLREKSASNNKQSSDLPSRETAALMSKDSDTVLDSKNISSALERISISTINYIPDETVVIKGGLNFKILKFSSEEQKKIELLREKLHRTR